MFWCKYNKFFSHKIVLNYFFFFFFFLKKKYFVNFLFGFRSKRFFHYAQCSSWSCYKYARISNQSDWRYLERYAIIASMLWCSKGVGMLWHHLNANLLAGIWEGRVIVGTYKILFLWYVCDNDYQVHPLLFKRHLELAPPYLDHIFFLISYSKHISLCFKFFV